MKRLFTMIFAALTMTTISGFNVYAGGDPSCVGITCARTYWTDAQRGAVEQRGFGGIWNALGERERAMFPNFYRAGGWAAQTAFGPWMQRNVWEPMDALPPDLGPGPLDNIGLIGAISFGKYGQKLGQLILGPSRGGPVVRETIANLMAGTNEMARAFGRAARERLTLVLPLHQGGQLFPPGARAAPSWRNTPSAIANGDLIRRINYANPRHAAIQLQRMIDTPEPFNFVILQRETHFHESDLVGDRYELLVAPHRRTGLSLINELGIKHVQLASGREVFFGGTIKARRNEQGWFVVEFTNNTGTYGPGIQVTEERLRISRRHIYEAFGYKVDDVIFKLFVPNP